MTMDLMVKAFEKEGFTVKKVYNCVRQVYEFNIEKDGHGYHADFYYPNSANAAVVDQAQRDFINQSIRNFNDAFACYMIDGMWPKINPYVNTDALDALAYAMKPLTKLYAPPAIDDVRFNGPATIVFWSDGTKTVVKTQDNEPFDPEKGLAMAIVKKVMGNTGSYYNEIKKWTEGYSESLLVAEAGKEIVKGLQKGFKEVTFTAELKDPVSFDSVWGMDCPGKWSITFDSSKGENE